MEQHPKDINNFCIVSASFGGIDIIHPFPRKGGARAFYFTDAATINASPAENIASWSNVSTPAYPPETTPSRLRSHYFKQQIHKLDEVKTSRWLVWADGAIEFHQTNFLPGLIADLADLPAARRAYFIPHPLRRSIKEEYEFIKCEIERANKYLSVRYKNEPLAYQMEVYRAKKWDDVPNLWCGGFWVIENSELFHEAWDFWWEQNLKFSIMDQLSLPVAFQLYGIKPRELDISIWSNPYFSHRGHIKLA